MQYGYDYPYFFNHYYSVLPNARALTWLAYLTQFGRNFMKCIYAALTKKKIVMQSKCSTRQGP